MTFEQTIAVAAAAGLLVGIGAFWLMLRLIRKSIAQAPRTALSPEQIRDVSDMTEQLQRLIADIDTKIGSHLSKLDQAMLQADAKAESLRGMGVSERGMGVSVAAATVPPVSERDADVSSACPAGILPASGSRADVSSSLLDGTVKRQQRNSEDADKMSATHAGETPATRAGGTSATRAGETPASHTDDEPVTLPGTWPIPPSRPETNNQPAPRDPARLQSPRHAEVLRLHRAGATAETIARKLQMDLGEVELVLRLHGAAAPK